MPNSFEQYTQAVKSSIETHAQRKGYRRTANAGDSNELADFMASLHPHPSLNLGQIHAAAEIIYKAVEFLHNPRRVHLEKVGGWASLGWARTPEEKPE